MKSLIIIWIMVILAAVTLVGYVDYYTYPAHADGCSGEPNGVCEFNPAITQWLQTYGEKGEYITTPPVAPIVTPTPDYNYDVGNGSS